MTQLPDNYAKLAEKYTELRELNKAISDAYVRLRTKIPGALKTKYAPTPEEIHALTEECLENLLSDLAQTRGQNECLEQQVAAIRKIVL